MAKVSTYKGMRSKAASKRPGTKAKAPSPQRSGLRLTASEQRKLAGMQVQIDQISRVLDEIEQSMRERDAW